MHVTPREQERLLLAAAADLARRRLARGAPLGATEAVALVCDEICELAWDGVALETVIERAWLAVPAAALLPGVASLVPVLEVEALFRGQHERCRREWHAPSYDLQVVGTSH